MGLILTENIAINNEVSLQISISWAWKGKGNRRGTGIRISVSRPLNVNGSCKINEHTRVSTW